MKEKVTPLIKEWLSKAKSDLNFARCSFTEFNNFYSQICILCHDSAEKYLKAYISVNGINPPKIHDLVTLFRQCLHISKNDKGVKRIENKCRKLNFYYIPLKYPSHYPPLNREKAQEAIKCADAIERIITKKL